MNKFAPYMIEVIPFLLCLRRLGVKIPKFVLFEIFWHFNTYGYPNYLNHNEVEMLLNKYNESFKFLILKFGSLDQVKRIDLKFKRCLLSRVNDLKVFKYLVENIAANSGNKFELSYGEFKILTMTVENLEIHKFILDYVKVCEQGIYGFDDNYESKNLYCCYYCIKCGADPTSLNEEYDPSLYQKLAEYKKSL